MRVLLALPVAAGVASIATIALIVMSERVRPNDARLWHGAWIALALASIVAPLAALAPPMWQVAFQWGPVNPAVPEAGLSAERLALAANIVAAVALIGTAIFSWRLIAGLRLALRLARRAAPLGPVEYARVERVAPGLAIRCRTHPRLRVPVAVGVRSGVILLPESWRAWPDDRLLAILSHEHAHVVRRDFAWNVAAAVQQAIYWWNPLAWVVARRIRLTAELACDREAAGGNTTVYARHLIATAQELSQSAWPSGILAPGAVTDLGARVDALLAPVDDTPMSRRALRVLLVLVAALVVLCPMLVQARVSPHQPPFDHTARHALRHQAPGHSTGTAPGQR